jgi:hypothetical protein
LITDIFFYICVGWLVIFFLFNVLPDIHKDKAEQHFLENQVIHSLIEKATMMAKGRALSKVPLNEIKEDDEDEDDVQTMTQFGS